MAIANKLKYVMGEKNKSRNDIAGVLKISKQAVSNKFNRDTFSADDLIKIADCLGVSLALIDNNKQIIFDLEDTARSITNNSENDIKKDAPEESV